MKGIGLKAVINVAVLVLIGIVGAGCSGSSNYLTVDFQQDQTLRYKIISDRNVTINWDKVKSDRMGRKGKAAKYNEYMEMVVAYRTVELDPSGLTTIEVTCESMKLKQSPPGKRRSRRKDAVKTFEGKKFTLTVWPSGKISDFSQLEQLTKQAGKAAMRPNSSRGRVKEPDMISDFIASQRFLWDSLSSIENPVDGVLVGQSWESLLSIPAPMLMRKARNVTYQLSEIRDGDKGKIAVITSSFDRGGNAPGNWPRPYPSGGMQVAGPFGLLRNYRIYSLKGEGEELFNMDLGKTESMHHDYEIEMSSSFPMGLGGKIPISIKQKLSMELID